MGSKVLVISSFVQVGFGGRMAAAMKRTTVASGLVVLVSALTGCLEGGPDEASDSLQATIQIANPNLRIAVVGAGPSGLTAAYTLKGLGYDNVTIYEKESAVGGKVKSLVVSDVRAELGAVFASPDYDTVLDIADDPGIQQPYVVYDNPRFILDDDNVKRTFSQFLLRRYTPAQIGAATLAYANVLATYPEIDQDGFVGISPDLHVPFGQFAAAKGMTPVAELMKSLVIGFGYSYYEDMPAIYALKLIQWLIKVENGQLVSPNYYVWPNGFQAIWTKVGEVLAAGGYNLKLSTTVTNIKRRTGKSTQVTSKCALCLFPETREFDVVIISAPLHAVPNFLEETAAERALFSKVKTSRYFVTLFAAAGMPFGETAFLHDHARPAKINHVNAWGNPGGSLPVYIAYQLVDKDIWPLFVTTTLIENINRLSGGVFLTPLLQKEWDNYFPRVDRATFDAGFFNQVDALQGQQGLYYVGGTLAFETVEHTASHARSLILDRFPDVN
jgi:oxygen-dependent protoporphyrinogen oxidase